MAQRIQEFFTTWYHEFSWPWNWESPPPPSSSKKKTKLQCEKVISYCRTSQYVLAVAVIAIVVDFDRSRQLFVNRAMEGFALFLTQILACVILGYFLGLKRMPANYISFVIVTIFVILEDRIKPHVGSYDVEILDKEHKWAHTFWSTVKITPKPPVIQTSAYARSGVLLLLLVAAFWIFNKYTKFDVVKYKAAILVSIINSSSFAALLLVSTFAFDEIPGFVKPHRKFCELWIIFSVTSLIIAFYYLFVKMCKIMKGEMKPDSTTIIEWEIYMFLLVLAITIRYIPSIHKGFSIPNVLNSKSVIIMREIIPTHLLKAVDGLVKLFGF